MTAGEDAGIKGPAPLFADILSLNGRWRGGEPALIVGDETVPWSALDMAANRVANGLAAMGLGPGDMVGVVMSNGRAMVEVLAGILKAGCCSVPINLSVTDETVAAMLEDSGSRALFATGDQVARVEAHAGLYGDRLRTTSIATGRERVGWAPYDDWLAAQKTGRLHIDISGDAPMNVIYSSGTTGLPKGIVHTHRGRLDWAYDIAVAYRYHWGARTLCTIGLYSNIMWAAMLGTWLSGGTLVVHEKFDPARTLEAISEHRITHIAMVPVQWRRLLEAGATGEHLASLESAITVGSPMPVDMKRRLHELMPDAFHELYGLTEGILTVLAPSEMERHIDSVGRPVAGCDIRILDGYDRPCPTGQAGEIVSRARYVMPGYLNRPDATAECLWTDAEGRQWLRTGDIGRLDEEGFLHIVDRKKDMILSGGQNIYPADIEAVLATHETVTECAVIGIPDEMWGETPLAIVVRREGAKVDAEELRDWVNARVGRQQRVKRLAFIDSLPRNPNGKVLKRELREWARKEIR